MAQRATAAKGVEVAAPCNSRCGRGVLRTGFILTAFPGHKQKVESQMAQLEHKLAPMWGAGTQK